MKAVPAWLVFTVLRVLTFAIPFVLLLALAIEGWLAAILAAVIGLCLSYIFLRKPRDTVARGLYEVRHRTKEPVHPDAESEDAAVDAAAATDSAAASAAANKADRT
ncbi:DUF4229 domain-containing protein [Cryobacterium sp. SO2]|uniref:DUF4229 domain-containing protein n=1 Tax=Cryobacterium sp. SO2 TaxID=1897060 RepID=UPI00223DB70C|nr:DUF4229 domain-containing protein [Cryobacterium sp. SO2]WEO77715.1 DUF4229 domain-containing protein [Cryobacterium sp. SO2]